MSNGFLTTHVLDTATGQPAANMVIKLYQNDDLITTMTTNSDGRTQVTICAAKMQPFPNPYFWTSFPLHLASTMPKTTITFPCCFRHTDTLPTGAVNV